MAVIGIVFVIRIGIVVFQVVPAAIVDRIFLSRSHKALIIDHLVIFNMQSIVDSLRLSFLQSMIFSILLRGLLRTKSVMEFLIAIWWNQNM
jgi:hypothetical protein